MGTESEVLVVPAWMTVGIVLTDRGVGMAAGCTTLPVVTIPPDIEVDGVVMGIAADTTYDERSAALYVACAAGGGPSDTAGGAARDAG